MRSERRGCRTSALSSTANFTSPATQDPSRRTNSGFHLKQCRLELEELGDELLGRADHRLSYGTGDAADEPARGVDCGAKREGRVGSEQSALPGLRFDVDATLRRNKHVEPRAHGIQRETQITFRPLDYFFNPTGANGMALYRRSEQLSERLMLLARSSLLVEFRLPCRVPRWEPVPSPCRARR